MFRYLQIFSYADCQEWHMSWAAIDANAHPFAVSTRGFPRKIANMGNDKKTRSFNAVWRIT
jgi:hypothetical protein